MKSLVILAISLISTASFAASPMNPCANEDSLTVARRASDVLVTKHKVLNTRGVTSVGVESCNPQQLARLAGYKVPAIVRRPVCGVVVGVTDQASVRGLALEIMQSIGSRIRVRGGETSICLKVTGAFVPEAR